MTITFLSSGFLEILFGLLVAGIGSLRALGFHVPLVTVRIAADDNHSLVKLPDTASPASAATAALLHVTFWSILLMIALIVKWGRQPFHVDALLRIYMAMGVAILAIAIFAMIKRSYYAATVSRFYVLCLAVVGYDLLINGSMQIVFLLFFVPVISLFFLLVDEVTGRPHYDA